MKHDNDDGVQQGAKEFSVPKTGGEATVLPDESRLGKTVATESVVNSEPEELSREALKGQYKQAELDWREARDALHRFIFLCERRGKMVNGIASDPKISNKWEKKASEAERLVQADIGNEEREIRELEERLLKLAIEAGRKLSFDEKLEVTKEINAERESHIGLALGDYLRHYAKERYGSGESEEHQRRMQEIVEAVQSKDYDQLILALQAFQVSKYEARLYGETQEREDDKRQKLQTQITVFEKGQEIINRLKTKEIPWQELEGGLKSVGLL